ncbi:FtsX-like permease family protein [Sporosarcina sp. FSL K6-1540]|uniref:ABC transporter permease n=1 Tax=Sporosarcina TaxID=1569 RepID=UPI00078EE89D|nr:FtsX-like permease family protein [Sporosarcina psychrophila]AMQ04864.1 macrolide ABC transporter permease [Sporosarcina psychrophila]
MQFKDQISFVGQHIKKNKMRVFMTVLAATMGTAFLIVLASVGFGLHETIRGEVLSNRLVTQIEVFSSEMDEEKVVELKKRDHVKAVVFRQNLGAEQQSSIGDFTGNSQLVVTDFTEEKKANFELQEGRLPEKVNEVVVGSNFAESLMNQQDENEDGEFTTYDGKLIGEQFNYQIGDDEGEMIEDKMMLTIVGIGKKPAKDWEQDQKIYADASIIPDLEKIYYAHVDKPVDDNTDAQQLFYGNVNVYADKLENVKAISTALKDDGYSVYSISEELDQLDVFFLALKAGLVFVGTIAILIASIGIFNTMTMAVTERTREIGVMKAIGADPKLIQRLFLMESAWIGIVGTVLAVVISYGVSIVSNYVLPIIVTAALGEEDFGDMTVTFSVIPWQLVVIASTISIGVAMISGWRPARKATKIDVINALRQEL